MYSDCTVHRRGTMLGYSQMRYSTILNTDDESQYGNETTATTVPISYYTGHCRQIRTDHTVQLACWSKSYLTVSYKPKPSTSISDDDQPLAERYNLHWNALEKLFVSHHTQPDGSQVCSYNFVFKNPYTLPASWNITTIEPEERVFEFVHESSVTDQVASSSSSLMKDIIQRKCMPYRCRLEWKLEHFERGGERRQMALEDGQMRKGNVNYSWVKESDFEGDFQFDCVIVPWAVPQY